MAIATSVWRVMRKLYSDVLHMRGVISFTSGASTETMTIDVYLAKNIGDVEVVSEGGSSTILKSYIIK